MYNIQPHVFYFNKSTIVRGSGEINYKLVLGLHIISMSNVLRATPVQTNTNLLIPKLYVFDLILNNMPSVWCVDIREVIDLYLAYWPHA